MHNPTKLHHPHSNIHNMHKNDAILKAIDDLNSQEVPNVNATAKKYNIVQSTLQRRFKGQTVSYTEAQSRSTMLLTTAQESALIEHINELSARNLHLTPQLLENLIVEIIRHPIGEQWMEQFCKHHSNKIKNIYLRSINQVIHITNNSRHFQHYFNTVRILLIYILMYIKFNQYAYE